MIGKIKRISKSEIEQNSRSQNEFIDKSVPYTHIIPGEVVKVSLFTTQEGRIMKVKMLLHRDVQVGDKFAARSAQKSTCGILERRAPFNKYGDTPQIIINVCSVGKRLTPSHFTVSGNGLLATYLRENIDSTAFNGMDVQTDIIDKLKKYGCKYAGDQTLYNGYTGMRIKSKIYMAVEPYQRLPHMSSNKNYARTSGAIQQKTKQPQQGRSKMGGLKYGEMETHAVEAHGACAINKEFMYDHSDAYQRILSEETKHWCSGNMKIKKYDDGKKSIKLCIQQLPWITHVINIYLEGIGISVNEYTDSDINENVIFATKDNLYNTPPFITKYEKTKLIGTRSMMLSYGAPTFIDDTDYTNIHDVVYEEYNRGKLDNMFIHRILPGGKEKLKVQVGLLSKIY